MSLRTTVIVRLMFNRLHCFARFNQILDPTFDFGATDVRHGAQPSIGREYSFRKHTFTKQA